ncbi:MAG: ComF family protein [Bacteroidales bacterium]
MIRWLQDLLMLFFPVSCPVCGKSLEIPGEVLCLGCEYRMPRTGFADDPENPVSMLFWGRVPVECGTSLFRFEKGSPYQALLHELKYRGNRRSGIYMGRLLGHELKQTAFSQCDLIIPVPLHRKRYRERGYNQSELIARGVSEVLLIPVETHVLVRSAQHDSQTSMGRLSRFENVSGNFRIAPHSPELSGKKILLIDDVVTTGATLEACATELLNTFYCRIYIATVCCA